MFASQSSFGCHSPAVLARVQRATDALAPTFNAIVSAAARKDGKTPDDIAAFVNRAMPQEMAYIEALDAYSSQFGADQLPQA
jgi:hypothetical protein